jgi:hypothetical protein
VCRIVRDTNQQRLNTSVSVVDRSRSEIVRHKKREAQASRFSAAGVAPYLYAAGSPESVGLAMIFFSWSLIGQFRLTLFGGIGDWNHFA